MTMLNFYLYYKKNNQLGLSLVELLVALALCATLSAGISAVYLENKRNFVQDEEMARLQENGRFAINMLNREIKMSGFFAASLPPVSESWHTLPVSSRCDSTGKWTFTASIPIDFINDFSGQLNTASGTHLLPACFGAKTVAKSHIVAGTDILMLKRTTDRPSISNGVYDSTLTAGNIKQGHWYVQLVNKGMGAKASASKYHQLIEDSFPSDVLVMGSGIDMWLYQSRIFFIRDYSVFPADNIPTLVLSHLYADSYIQEAFIEGVEAFHVEFGIRALNSATKNYDIFFVDNPAADHLKRYDPAVIDFGRVSVVRIHLLLRTREEIRGYVDSKSYQLGSKSIASVDLNHGSDSGDFRRRVFTTTIKVRNF